MRRARKSLIGLAALSVAALTLTSCSGAEPTTDDEGRTVVTFWHSMRGNNGEQLQEYIEEFNESQSEIVIQASEQGMYDEAYTKLMQVAATDDAPDLMQMGRVRETVDAAIISPMQGFIDGDEEFDEESLLPAVRGPYTVDGELQYMPQSASTNVVFYNVDAFREAGIDPDTDLTTYADFEEAAQQLTDELGMDHGGAFLIDGGTFNALMGVRGEILVNNGNGHEAPPTEAVFNDTAGVETMTWVQELYDAGLTGNYGRSFDDMRQPWYTEQIGMIVDTTAATIMHEEAADFEVDSMPLPVPEGSTQGAAPLGGAGLAILSDSPEETQQAAYEFVKFLASPEIQARWATNTGYFPVHEGAYDEQVLIDAMAEIPALASANEQAQEAGDDVGTLGALSGVNTSLYIADAWEAIYSGTDPQVALDDAANEVTSLLETYNEAN